MNYLFIMVAIAFSVITTSKTNAQGCVAIRSNGNTCSMSNPATAKGWQLNFNNRYFKSYKHFVGTIEQKERAENHTEVINHSYSLDITATRYFNSRWSLAMTVPVISNTRSALYEHGGNSNGATARHSTQTFGIGDLRISAYRWLFDPAKHHKGKQRRDELLLNILPAETAEELKETGTAQAKSFDSVSVLFTDFKNFTQISEKLSSSELVAEINRYYSEFDTIIT